MSSVIHIDPNITSHWLGKTSNYNTMTISIPKILLQPHYYPHHHHYYSGIPNRNDHYKHYHCYNLLDLNFSQMIIQIHKYGTCVVTNTFLDFHLTIQRVLCACHIYASGVSAEKKINYILVSISSVLPTTSPPPAPPVSPPPPTGHASKSWSQAAMTRTQDPTYFLNLSHCQNLTTFLLS